MALAFMVGALYKDRHGSGCQRQHCLICGECLICWEGVQKHPELPGYYCNTKCLTFAPLYWQRILHEWTKGMPSGEESEDEAESCDTCGKRIGDCTYCHSAFPGVYCSDGCMNVGKKQWLTEEEILWLAGVL
jgi:hypothetical protein